MIHLQYNPGKEDHQVLQLEGATLRAGRTTMSEATWDKYKDSKVIRDLMDKKRLLKVDPKLKIAKGTATKTEAGAKPDAKAEKAAKAKAAKAAKAEAKGNK